MLDAQNKLIDWQTIYRCVKGHHPMHSRVQFVAGNDYPLLERGKVNSALLNHQGMRYNLRNNSQFVTEHFTIVKVAMLQMYTMDEPVACELLGVSHFEGRSVLTVRELESKAVWMCLHVHGKDKVCGFALQNLTESEHIEKALSFAWQTEQDRNKGA